MLTDDARDALAKAPACAPVVLALMERIETRLRELIAVIEAHECESLSCDRDGQQHCDCLRRATERAKAIFPPVPNKGGYYEKR